jgi:molybdate transport system substrate-binding protein
MNIRSIVAAIVTCVFVSTSQTASAAELKIFTARAIATILQEIGPQFEKETGHKLNVIAGLSSEFVPRILAGEAFDVVGAPPGVLKALDKRGKIAADSMTNLVRSDVGVGVRKGAPKPDISTVEAFKRTLLNAKSITYLNVPGVPQLVDRLGLKDAIASKVTMPHSDIVSELVAKGDIEMVIVVVTQIMTTPGVDLVGPLPPEIRISTAFGAAVSASSKESQAARDLLKFLKGPTALPVIKAQGMEPI